MLNARPNHFTEIAFRSLVSVFFCLLFGYIFFQLEIFNRHAGAFSIPVFGLIGSVFFYTLLVDTKNAYAALIVMLFMNSALLTHATMLTYLLRDVLIVGAVAAAMVLYHKYFYGKYSDKRWREPLVLAVLVAILVLIVAIISLVMFGVTRVLSVYWIFYILRLYFLIGLGTGCGIIATEDPYASRIRTWMTSFRI